MVTVLQWRSLRRRKRPSDGQRSCGCVIKCRHAAIDVHFLGANVAFEGSVVLNVNIRIRRVDGRENA